MRSRKLKISTCEGLRPIAQLHVPLKELRTRTIDDIAREMVGKQVIGIRFTPALRRDKQTTKYLLDPDTVNIRVNGYSPKRLRTCSLSCR